MDEQVLEQVERLDDKKTFLSSKEQAELDRIEKTRDYLRQQIHLQEEKHQQKLEYFQKQLEECERKESLIRNLYTAQVSRTERKQEKLSNKIVTPAVKQQATDISQSTVPIVPAPKTRFYDQTEIAILMKREEAKEIEKKMMEKYSEIRRLDAQMKTLKCRPNVSEEEIDALQFQINGLVQEREFLKQTIPKF